MMALKMWKNSSFLKNYGFCIRTVFRIEDRHISVHNRKSVKICAALCTENEEKQTDFGMKGIKFGNKPRFSRNGAIYSNRKQMKRAFMLLNSSIRRSNRIYKVDLEKILQDAKTEGITEDIHGVLLLQCCGDLLPDEHPDTRVEFAHKIWNSLQELGVRLTVEHYNALLSCYVENGHVITPESFLADMKDVEPNEETYHLMLACVCEVGDIEQATEIVSLMKAKSFPASEPVFTALVRGHARAGDISSSHGILDLMQAAKVTPTSVTYTALLQSFAEIGDFENLYKTYKEAHFKSIVLNEEQIMKIVKSLVTAGHQSAMKDVLKWLPELDPENSTAVRNMIIHLLHLGYEDAACTLLDVLPAPTFEFSPSFGVFLIQEMIRANSSASRIVLLTDKLVSDGRNQLALEKAAGVALNQGKTHIALSLFEAMKHRNILLRPHYFWPLFMTASRKNGEKGIFQILQHMQEFGVTPDFDTLADYILPHISLIDTEMVIRKLQDYGLNVVTILSPMLAVLLKTSNMECAVKLCEVYKSHLQSDRLVQPLMLGYVTTHEVSSTVKILQFMTSSRGTETSDWVGQFVLTVLMFRKIRTEPDQLCALLKEFQSANLRISSFAADFIMGHLQSRMASEEVVQMKSVVDDLVNADFTVPPSEYISVQIPHPREMSLEDLECHLVELKSKDLNKRGVLRRLIQEYCRQGNVQKALEAKHEFEVAGYEFSAGMLAMLFDLMVRVGNLAEAERTLKNLNHVAPDFILDEHKILDFATLLVSENKSEVAIAMLKEHASNHTVKGGPAVSRNCWRLLNAAAVNGNAEQTRTMLQKLTEYGYCTINNILLGPLIRAYLSKNDFDGAVREFKRCTKEHKATPLQHELLCQLAVKADKQGSGVPSQKAANLLQEVLNACTRVHGVPSTHVTLAVALAEMGLIKQLKHFLMEPHVKLRRDHLTARLKRLANENKLEVLKNLLEASKSISTFDVGPVYMAMLQLYGRRGDCDGALSLWTSIQDADVQPSSEFLNILAALLRSHKREIPFVVTNGEEKSLPVHSKSKIPKQITKTSGDAKERTFSQ